MKASIKFQLLIVLSGICTSLLDYYQNDGQHFLWILAAFTLASIASYIMLEHLHVSEHKTIAVVVVLESLLIIGGYWLAI